MNGARAEPSASMSNPPSPHTMTITGVSHNFLRTRSNFHKSLPNSTINSSELLVHRGLLFTNRGTSKPVGWLLRLEPKPQRILADPPHDDCDRGQHGEEHNTHNNWIKDL